MDVFNFVVSQGAVIDAARYEQALRNLGVRPTELQRLRIQLADVGGTRRAVLEVAGGAASLMLRPLPPAAPEITVLAEPVADERAHPDHLGPDLGWQRTMLAQIPADDGLLAHASGRILSAIVHPLLIVEPGRITLSSHHHSPRSVALDGIVDLLTTYGIHVVHNPGGFDMAALMSNEVWIIDPVYGARLVETWLEYGTRRPARLVVNRDGVPSHREINEARRALAVSV